MPVAQEDATAAASVCDEKIREWLLNRNKFQSQKRKRGVWIKKLNARRTDLQRTPTANTPKRSTNAPRRITRSAGVVDDNADVFSPVAKSMFKTPVVKHVKKNVRKQIDTGKKKQTGFFFCYDTCLCYLLLP